MSKEVIKPSPFKWTKKRSQAVELLAQGYLIKEVAEAVGVTKRTIFRWKNDTEFASTLDKMSLTFGLASKAERARKIARAARQFENEDGSIELGRAEWLDLIKEMRLLNEGLRLNIVSELIAIDEEAGSVAGARPDRGSELDQAETDETD